MSLAAGLMFWWPTVLEAMSIAVTSYYDELCTNVTGEGEMSLFFLCLTPFRTPVAQWRAGASRC